MYAHTLRYAAHIRKFTITSSPSATGWVVRDERDDKVIRNQLYRDWHRVERARNRFALEAADLRDAGWTDSY